MSFKVRQRFSQDTVQPVFADFMLMPPPETKSWRLRHAGGKTDHWFQVIWSPGRLQISGDIGSCAYEGPTFFRSWPEAAEGVLECDLSYLTGKSGIREVYDQAATVAEIFGDAASEAIDARRAEREGMQQWRRELFAAERHDRAWHLDDDSHGPIWFEADIERPEISDLPRTSYKVFGHPVKTEPARFSVPDGWAPLHRLQQELAPWQDLNAIFTPAGRREMRRELETICESQEAAYRLCSAIGMEDYYGSYNLPSSAVWYFEAIQTWARLVVQTEEFGEAITPCRARRAEERRRHSLRDELFRRARHLDRDREFAADDDGMPIAEVA